MKRSNFKFSVTIGVLALGLIAILGIALAAEWLNRRHLSQNPNAAFASIAHSNLPEGVTAVAFTQCGWGFQNQSAYWHLKHDSVGLTNLLRTADWGVDDQNLNFLESIPLVAGWSLPKKPFANCYESEPARGWNHFLIVAADGTESFLIRVKM